MKFDRRVIATAGIAVIFFVEMFVSYHVGYGDANTDHDQRSIDQAVIVGGLYSENLTASVNGTQSNYSAQCMVTGSPAQQAFSKIWSECQSLIKGGRQQ